MAALHADRAQRGKEVLGVGDVARSLTRIAYEIVERNGGGEGLVIAGIPTRGATLARRLVNRIREVSGTYADLAIIDTTLFRDDLASQPLRSPKETLIPAAGIDGKTIILVDDVLYTGRTIKAALDALTRIGRPSAVQLAVLVDRGHRELPIRPDYVGKNLPTSREETVTILLDETDGRDGVLLGKGR
ncbi:bifunctional pyr operon transcriptional regulator/uracil phosphoribosyltransferase PyrR [Schaalia odontolytica]|uniref:bifunctional pyr operon transcriptional regulator/uracil phosphoribosyltransferase PyrR n=1 Tax=Schaalia odontolytica TaxID=1660 RepID=UPI00065FB88C|nr:bifunctional pyr operon transcriptional regulator/uracil phosphoribosyltransferase PyrR [Schaalia odontolytica]UUO94108.1 bifunctional pyr operon transcriptional regulator/uracil phosphoribosyltransferase PyrR [Schaalia odontolytica]